ncbi:hypothetical protein FH039_07095 [Thermococcus indicus]|uniref:Uncharacterized protein n=1 Tax=Thermococcus indicus TaxID=2586643 RepID=A0A4Y5SML7_9EURY|nr:hypothetical protein [Thermococcus indicus]QDA31412.1 hypothetical protein FH039_07095 [Thermococcus indicus]
MKPEDGPITLGDVKLLVRELLGYTITDHQLKKDLMEWLRSKGLTVDDVRIRRGKSFRYNLPVEFVEYELELCKKRQEGKTLSRELYGEFPFVKIHQGTLEELSKKFERLPSHELYPLVKAAIRTAIERRGASAQAQLVIEYTCWGLCYSHHNQAAFRPVVILNAKSGLFVMARYTKNGVETRLIDDPFVRPRVK